MRHLVSFAVLLVLLVSSAFAFFPGYTVTNSTNQPWGLEAYLQIINGAVGPYGNDIPVLKVQVYYQSETTVRIKIFDPVQPRWEVPGVLQVKPPTKAPATMNYIFSMTQNPFGFAVTRVSDGSVLVNTTSPPSGTQFSNLIFEDQLLTFSSQMVQQPNLYGLGERVHSYRLDSSGSTYTMWNRDWGGSPENLNLYGTHPMYMELRNGLAHGVFLLNSNAQDVYMGPYILTWQAIGGIVDLWVFTGDTPAQVVSQYTEVIGRPHMPAYWTLGFHQCRYGYYTIEETIEIAQNYTMYNLPLDTIWNDINYMNDYHDFTFDPVAFPLDKVQEFVNFLHNRGQHYVVIVDPAIGVNETYQPFLDGIEADIFIKDAIDKLGEIGKQWPPGYSFYPDFWHPSSYQYWYKQISEFWHNDAQVDGLWIDMNEISNFCNGACNTKYEYHGPDQWDNPPYTPGGVALNTSTLSMDAHQYIGINYNTHNLYGFTEAAATDKAITTVRGKRSFVLSRSTFAGSGRYTAHWTGDNYSTWEYLYYSITGILSMQLFGIPQTGADICGFNDNTTAELCSRWMQVGAFYPFSRNHNTWNTIAQEPWALGPGHLAISYEALRLRYFFLPYFYTLFFEAHVNGSTVWRPMLFEYPHDNNTIYLDRQFMVGNALLVAPQLNPGQTTVQVYLPADRWFDYFNGTQMGSTTVGVNINVPTPMQAIPLFVRGGTIIPGQMAGSTTAESRKNPFKLVAGVSTNGTAYGYVYLDDGESLNSIVDGLYSIIEFSISTSNGVGTLKSTVDKNGFNGTSVTFVGTLLVYGVDFFVASVSVNGIVIDDYSWHYNDNGSVFIGGMLLRMDKPFTVSWSNKSSLTAKSTKPRGRRP